MTDSNTPPTSPPLGGDMCANMLTYYILNNRCQTAFLVGSSRDVLVHVRTDN